MLVFVMEVMLFCKLIKINSILWNFQVSIWIILRYFFFFFFENNMAFLCIYILIFLKFLAVFMIAFDLKIGCVLKMKVKSEDDLLSENLI